MKPFTCKGGHDLPVTAAVLKSLPIRNGRSPKEIEGIEDVRLSIPGHPRKEMHRHESATIQATYRRWTSTTVNSITFKKIHSTNEEGLFGNQSTIKKRETPALPSEFVPRLYC